MVTRAELATQFESLASGSLWKTFVIEVHSNGDPIALLEEVFGKCALEQMVHAVVGVADRHACR